MRTKGDEPAVCDFGSGSGGAAGDGPPAFRAAAFRALLRSHLRAIVTRAVMQLSEVAGTVLAGGVASGPGAVNSANAGHCGHEFTAGRHSPFLHG